MTVRLRPKLGLDAGSGQGSMNARVWGGPGGSSIADLAKAVNVLSRNVGIGFENYPLQESCVDVVHEALKP